MSMEGTDAELSVSTPPFVGNLPTQADGVADAQVDIPVSPEDVLEESAACEFADVSRKGAAAARPPAQATVAAPLPASWTSATKSRREIPKAAKVGAAGLSSLLLLVFALPRACGGPVPPHTTMVPGDPEVEGAEFLRKRRHLTDEDFRGHRASPVRVESVGESTAASVDMEERQRLRENNPEDVRGAAKRAAAGRGGASRYIERSREPEDSKSLLVFFDNTTPAEERSGTSDSASVASRLLPAASTVRIRLAHDIVIRRGRTTVIAVVGKGQLLPVGSKLLGNASADRDGMAVIRFDTIVFSDGESLRAHAEAVDAATGSQTLMGSVTGGRIDDDHSVARSVGSATAERAAMGALGGGLVGGAAQQTISESRRQRRSPAMGSTVVTIPRELELEALFLREVRREGRR